MKKIIIAFVAILASIIGFAAPANAVTWNPGADVGLSDGAQTTINDFNYFLQTHPGQWITVCVRGLGNGGNVRVSTPYWTDTLHNFPSGQYVTRCLGRTNTSPGWGPLTVKSVNGAIYLDWVSVN